MQLKVAAQQFVDLVIDDMEPLVARQQERLRLADDHGPPDAPQRSDRPAALRLAGQCEGTLDGLRTGGRSG